MLKNHTTKFHLACLIIALPFYAHTKEQPVQSEKQLVLTWNFSIKRTTPEVTQEWLQLIANYGKAALTIFDSDTHQEIQELFAQLKTLAQEKSFILSLTCDQNIPDTCNCNPKKLQPFTGQLLANILEEEHTEGIHGSLWVSFTYPELRDSTELLWKLEIYLDDTYDHETFATIKDNLAVLTDELNTASLTPDNQNHGRLLHGVATTAHQTQAYSCNATLTLRS